MVVIGIDSHKSSHTAVAVDATGRRLATTTVPARSAGHLELLRWASARFPERRFALEDCRHLSRRLSNDLLVAGESVVRVHPKLMAGARRMGREPGKSDPIDALAVARAALREDLPIATLDGPERDVRLLVDHREDFVAERTRIVNRLRWHLHELDPGHEPVARSLDRAVVLAALERDLAGRPGLVARLARELVGIIRELTAMIDALEREIGRLVADLAPNLLAMVGCGPLTAAKLVGETAGIGRFRSSAAFARHNGTAPLPVWSGDTVRHRLSRTGNRQLNVAIHRIAITQMRLDPRARAYIQHRQTLGDTKTEAIRAFRRHLSNVVFARMRHDEAARAARPTGHAAAA
jgi:transposase